MRLLKLIGFAVLGYALYELYLGITRAPADVQPPQPPAQQGRKRPASSRAGRPAMTGPGVGMRVPVADSDGAATQEIVGRGVIQR